MTWLIIIVPITLLVFYFLAILFGMKPLHRSRVHTQVFSRLASKIDFTNVAQSNDDGPPTPLAAMFFYGADLVNNFWAGVFSYCFVCHRAFQVTKLDNVPGIPIPDTCDSRTIH